MKEENDIWADDLIDRKKVSSVFTKIVNNTRGSMVASVSAPFGTGKTFFATRWVQQLRAEAGDDWPEIVGDKSQFEAFAETLQITRMRERGEVPSHYTALTECKNCGTVPIFDGSPPKVDACPWCFNRIAGRRMPHYDH